MRDLSHVPIRDPLWSVESAAVASLGISSWAFNFSLGPSCPPPRKLAWRNGMLPGQNRAATSTHLAAGVPARTPMLWITLGRSWGMKVGSRGLGAVDKS